MRTIETWWDSYKHFFYEKRPEWANVDPGDLTEVRAIREKLKCKPFEWFMKEIAYDVTKYYPLHQVSLVTENLRDIWFKFYVSVCNMLYFSRLWLRLEN